MAVKSACALAALWVVTMTAPSLAEPVGYRYEINWGGFHAGDLAISRDQQGETTRTGMTIRTVGLFDRMLRLRFNAEGTGHESGGGGLASDSYQTRYRNRYHETLLRLAFGGGDARTVLDEVVAVFAPPPADDEPNPPVPPEARQGAGDPLTNLAVVGRRARDILASGGPPNFRTGSFDGRRAYDFDVSVRGRNRISIGERQFDTIELAMVLRPVAGFKPKFAKMWAGAEYVVNIDPDTLLPLRIFTDSFAAATVINAVEPCRMTAEQCGPALTASIP